MTYATEKLKAGRRKFEVVELDLDACSLIYSIAPCTAAIVSSGWNTDDAVYAGSLHDADVSAIALSSGMDFSRDGLHLLMVSPSLAEAHSFTLSLADETSSAVWDGAGKKLDVSSQDSAMNGLAISADGFHVFMVGITNDKVYSYSLTRAFDLSTATHNSGSDLDISGQTLLPIGIALSADGLHFFVVGNDNVKVYAYTMTAANGLGTASYDGAPDDLDVSGQITDPVDVALSADGLKLCINGFSDQKIFAYTFGIAHDGSSLTYDGAGADIDVSAEASQQAYGIAFSSSIFGGAIFQKDQLLGTVFKYDLNNTLAKCFNTFATCQDTDNYAQEIKTYRFSSPIDGISRAYDAIPSIRSIISAPAKLDPGRSLGKRAKVVITFQDHPHHDRGIDKYALERADGTAGVPAYTPANQGSFFGKLHSRNPHYVGRILRVMTGFLPWDHDEGPGSQASASEATVEANLDTRTYVIDQWNGPDASGRFMIIAKDLLKLAEDSRAECPVRNTGALDAGISDSVLSAITTTYDGVGADLDLSGLGSTLGAMAIDQGTGVNLFVADSVGGVHKVHAYTMGTPFDLSTAGFIASLVVAFPFSSLIVSDDGLVLWGQAGANIRRYNMSVAFDITSAVLVGLATNGLAVVTASADGVYFYFRNVGDARTIDRWVLTGDPWDFDNSQISGSIALDSSEIVGGIAGLSISADGSRLYVVDSADDKIHFYTMLSPFAVSSATYDGSALDYDLNAEDASPALSLFAHSGDRLAFPGQTNQTLYSYTLTNSGVVTLSPAGVGNLEYETAGTVRIGDELMLFARDGDDLLFTARGAFDTIAAAHDAGDLVQQAKHFSTVRVDFILQDLLENFAGIDPSFIPITDWNDEISTFLATFILSTIISEPVGVTSLINELSQQCLVLLRWDELDQEFNLTALRSTLPELIVTDANTIQGTLRQVDSPKDRLTRVTILYGRLNTLVRLDDRTGFIFSHTSTDSVAETADEFGDIRNLNLNSRWFSSGQASVVEEAADGILARYVDTPAVFQFSLDVKDATIWTGSIIEIQSRVRQDTFGQVGSQIAQVIEARELPNGNFAYKAISI